MTEPEPPGDIPAYIAAGIARQDRETLAAIQDYAQARRAYLETLAAQSVDETALPDSDEQLVDVEEGQDGRVVIKRVPCGKDCDGCLMETRTSCAARETVLSGRTGAQLSHPDGPIPEISRDAQVVPPEGQHTAAIECSSAA